MELVPRLHIGDGLYAGNALVKNRSKRVYIKIMNTWDIDKRIVVPEVELEELDKIATSHLKNSSLCNKDVQMRALNIIATNNIQTTRSCFLRELLRLDYLNKKEAIRVDRIINKYSSLFQFPDEPLGHTDVTAHKIVITDDRPISTIQIFPFHEINRQMKNLMMNDVIMP